MVRLLKLQNGIFIDLGKIIPLTFPLKIAPVGLLRIYKKGVDFLKRALVLLFRVCYLALFNILFAYKHLRQLILQNSMGQHFFMMIHLCEKFFKKRLEKVKRWLRFRAASHAVAPG